MRRRSFEAWTGRVKAICGEVSNFSEEPALIQDNRFFYEPVHFNAKAGRWMLERVFPARTKAP